MKSLIMMFLLQIMMYPQVHLYTIPASANNNQTYSLVSDTNTVYLLDRTHSLRFQGDTCIERYIVINPDAGFASKQIQGATHRQLTDQEAAQLIDASVLFRHRRPAGANWEVNQRVEIGDIREYSNQSYTCLQAHVTLQSWNPTLTLGVLWTLNATGYTWQVGISYSVGDSVTYQSSSYHCLQAHVSQQAWNPVATLNVLWAEYQQQVTCPQWVQPNSTNPYMIGDCVTFNGLCYESRINNNVWSPSAYPAGWLQTECP